MLQIWTLCLHSHQRNCGRNLYPRVTAPRSLRRSLVCALYSIARNNTNIYFYPASKVRSSTAKAHPSQTNNENQSIAPSRIGMAWVYNIFNFSQLWLITGPHCSQQPNIGEGGALVQLTNVSDAIEHQPAPLKNKVVNRVVNIPSAQLSNPMAPTNMKSKHGRPPKVFI